jgi:hypothetical protein
MAITAALVGVVGKPVVMSRVGKHSAQRFAEQVVRQHCQEGTFEIEIDSEDLSDVHEALEAIGCIVERDMFKPRLKVICPSEAATA